MWTFTVSKATFDCHSEIFLSDWRSISFIWLIAVIICSWTRTDFASYCCFISSDSLSNSSSSIALPSTTGII